MLLDRRSTLPTDLPRIVAVCLETIRITSGRRSIFVAPRQGSIVELCSGKLLGMKKALVSMLALLGIHQHLSAELRLADASPAALIEYARALGKVFGQCCQRYTVLAIRTDGHAADAATCRAAWPVIPQTKETR